MRRIRTRLAAVTVALLCAGALSGCSTNAYDSDAAEELQARTLVVAKASAGGDWLGALKTLDELAADLADARAAGKLDEPRYRSIAASVDLVRTDLEANISADQAAEAQRLADEQAALEQARQDDNGNGNGKDKGKDKGKNGD